MRFSFLRCAPLILMASLAVGCGDDDNTTTPDQPAPQATPTPTPAPTASPTPSPTPAPPDSGELQSFFGTIDAIDSGSINLSDRVFQVDKDTLVFDHQTPITYAQLSVGQTALIKARKMPDGGWLAREIKLREP